MNFFTPSCRICLQLKPTNRNLFEQRYDGRQPTNVKLSLITGIHVPEKMDDIPEYPKFLCKDCEKLLDMAFDLRIKARKSDEILSNWYKKIGKRAINLVPVHKEIPTSTTSISNSAAHSLMNSLKRQATQIEAVSVKKSLALTKPAHSRNVKVLVQNSEKPPLKKTPIAIEKNVTKKLPSPKILNGIHLQTTKTQADDNEKSDDDSIFEVLSIVSSEENDGIIHELDEEDFEDHRIQIERVESLKQAGTSQINDYLNPELVCLDTKKETFDLMKIKSEWKEEIEENESCDKNKNDIQSIPKIFGGEHSKTEVDLDVIKTEVNIDDMEINEVSQVIYNKNIHAVGDFIIKTDVEENGTLYKTDNNCSSEVYAKRIKLEDTNDMEIDLVTGVLYNKKENNATSEILNT